MLKNGRVATRLPAQNLERAKAFYARTLGLRFVSEDPFALVFDAAGTMLRVAVVPQLKPAGYTVLGWLVPDIRRAIRGLVRRGVAFERFDGFGQDEDGIWASPSGARVAWFRDPDGNMLSLTQVPAAKTRKKPARA